MAACIWSMVASSSWKPPHGGIGKSCAESAFSWRGKNGTFESSNWLHTEDIISIDNIRLRIVAIHVQQVWACSFFDGGITRMASHKGKIVGLLAAIKAFHAYNLGTPRQINIASLSLVGSAYLGVYLMYDIGLAYLA